MSRLYLGVHWLTDVLTGWLLGGAWLALCLALLHRPVTRQRAARQPTAQQQHDEKRLLRHPEP